MRRTAGALGAVGALLAAILLPGSEPAVAAPATGTPVYGMSQGFQPIELPDARLHPLLDDIAASGVTMIRLDLSWNQIQPTSANDFRITNTLRVYDAAIARGLDVLPVTSGMPAWAGTTSPTSSASYEQFLRKAGDVLIPRGITTIEVQNEANITGMSPAEYTAKVLIPGARGYRAAATALGVPVQIVSTGLAPAKTGGGHWSQLDYVTGIYAAGGRSSFDILGTHPYTWPADPSGDFSWNWMKNTQQLHDVMTRNGDGAKQVWATEFGFPTNVGERGISESLQAKYLASGAAVWNTLPFAGPLIFYSYRDLTSLDADPEHNFGMTRADGSAKPSLAAVKSLTDAARQDAALPVSVPAGQLSLQPGSCIGSGGGVRVDPVVPALAGSSGIGVARWIACGDTSGFTLLDGEDAWVSIGAAGAGGVTTTIRRGACAAGGTTAWSGSGTISTEAALAFSVALEAGDYCASPTGGSTPVAFRVAERAAITVWSGVTG